MITGKLYNVLKFLAMVALPGLGTLYFTLAGIWGLPSAEQVVGTIVAVDAFLGVILQLSAKSYDSSTAQGTIAVHETAKGKTFQLELDGDPEYELENRERAVFKVTKSTEPLPPVTRSVRDRPTRRSKK